MEEKKSQLPVAESISDHEISPTHELSLEARVEALLFVSSGPVSLRQLVETLEVPTGKVKTSLGSLEHSLLERGIRIQRFGSTFQLTSAPELAKDVEKLLMLEDTSRLSRAALEALAIIAYQQPVTRPQIDSIRGVNSDSVLRTLLRYGLIEETGRSMSPGRPILYSTTAEFLQHFGLGALEELPPLDPELISEFPEADQQERESQVE